MLTFYINFQTAISYLSFKTFYQFTNISANFRTKFSLLNQAGFDPNKGKENMILRSSAGFLWVSNFKFPTVLCDKPWKPPTVQYNEANLRWDPSSCQSIKYRKTKHFCLRWLLTQFTYICSMEKLKVILHISGRTRYQNHFPPIWCKVN